LAPEKKRRKYESEAVLDGQLLGLFFFVAIPLLEQVWDWVKHKICEDLPVIMARHIWRRSGYDYRLISPVCFGFLVLYCF